MSSEDEGPTEKRSYEVNSLLLKSFLESKFARRENLKKLPLELVKEYLDAFLNEALFRSVEVSGDDEELGAEDLEKIITELIFDFKA
jgi:hypothetical protein